jgi:hypothetical protein
MGGYREGGGSLALRCLILQQFFHAVGKEKRGERGEKKGGKKKEKKEEERRKKRGRTEIRYYSGY